MNLPWLVRAGLSLLALGGAGGVACHSACGHAQELVHGMHVLALVGMVATLAGILLEAAR